MSVCEHLGCQNPISKSGKKFCSLSCASREFARVRSKAPLVVKVCLECLKDFSGTASDMHRQIFCSRSCAARRNNRLRPKRTRSANSRSPVSHECPGCGVVTEKVTYCSRDCKKLHSEALWLDGTMSGTTKYGTALVVRTWLYKRSGGQCEGTDSRTGDRCTEDRVVHLDHVDGNWLNNRPDNVRHLCPTCHALTDTYSGKNRGRGRTWKQMYSQYESLTPIVAVDSTTSAW